METTHVDVTTGEPDANGDREQDLGKNFASIDRGRTAPSAGRCGENVAEKLSPTRRRRRGIAREKMSASWPRCERVRNAFDVRPRRVSFVRTVHVRRARQKRRTSDDDDDRPALRFWPVLCRRNYNCCRTEKKNKSHTHALCDKRRNVCACVFVDSARVFTRKTTTVFRWSLLFVVRRSRCSLLGWRVVAAAFGCACVSNVRSRVGEWRPFARRRSGPLERQWTTTTTTRKMRCLRGENEEWKEIKNYEISKWK